MSGKLWQMHCYIVRLKTLISPCHYHECFVLSIKPLALCVCVCVCVCVLVQHTALNQIHSSMHFDTNMSVCQYDGCVHEKKQSVSKRNPCLI